MTLKSKFVVFLLEFLNFFKNPVSYQKEVSSVCPIIIRTLFHARMVHFPRGDKVLCF